MGDGRLVDLASGRSTPLLDDHPARVINGLSIDGPDPARQVMIADVVVEPGQWSPHVIVGWPFDPSIVEPDDEPAAGDAP